MKRERERHNDDAQEGGREENWKSPMKTLLAKLNRGRSGNEKVWEAR